MLKGGRKCVTNPGDLPRILGAAAVSYPEELKSRLLADVARAGFHIRLTTSYLDCPVESAEVCDVGGGIGLFSVGCALLDMKRVVLVDDFNDAINRAIGDSVLDIHRSCGVLIEARDVVRRGVADLEGQFDAFTFFDTVEHWHHSPKRVFHEAVAKLRPGGIFILGGPNCVNLRKRISVPLGRGKWTMIEDWYEQEIFRGHVREPDVADLLYIARDLKLSVICVVGRNWAGVASKNNWIRTGTRLLDYLLRLRPSLCSDIYLVGRKEVGSGDPGS